MMGKCWGMVGDQCFEGIDMMSLTSGLNAIAFFQYCDLAEVSKIVRMCYSSSIGGSFFSFSFLSCSLPISEMLFSGVGKFSGEVEGEV